MIVDADCHLSSDSELGMTTAGLLEQMNKAAVDKALVWLKPPYNRDIATENQAVFTAIQAHPDRLLGFGWANPRLGKTATERTIKTCFEHYKFYGLKFNAAHDYVIDDPTVTTPPDKSGGFCKHARANAPRYTHKAVPPPKSFKVLRPELFWITQYLIFIVRWATFTLKEDYNMPDIIRRAFIPQSAKADSPLKG